MWMQENKDAVELDDEIWEGRIHDDEEEMGGDLSEYVNSSQRECNDIVQSSVIAEEVDGVALTNPVQSNLVGFQATPQVVVHRFALVAGADAFTPFPEASQNATPTDGTGRQIADSVYKLRPPLIRQKIPRCFDRRVRCPQRFHELHIQVRRQIKARCGINLNVIAHVSPNSFRLFDTRCW